MNVHYICAWCPQKPEKGMRCPGIGIRKGSELPGGCQESHLGPLAEWLVGKVWLTLPTAANALNCQAIFPTPQKLLFVSFIKEIGKEMETDNKGI